MPVEITSRKNELVKDMLHLSGSAQFRKEKRRFVAEGARLCSDAAESGLKVYKLLYTSEAGEKYKDYLNIIRKNPTEEYIISPSVAQYLSDTKNTQGIFCMCEMPNENTELPLAGKIRKLVVLENIQDPANLGAVLRTAEALGIGGVVLSGNCCDAFTAKVLRASMGAMFRIPLYWRSDAPEAVSQLNKAGYSTLAAVPDSSAIPVTSMQLDYPAAVVIGNEGNGLTRETQLACSSRVTIPMQGRAESLNAAASAAILMWEMMRTKTGGDHS